MATFILIILMHFNHGHHYGQHKHPATTCVVRHLGVYYVPGTVFCDTPIFGGDQ